MKRTHRFPILVIVPGILLACSTFSCNQSTTINEETTYIMKDTMTTADITLPGDTTLPTSSEDLMELVNAAEGDFKYSVEDFFRTPEKSRYQLSPDGTHFAYMGPYERRQNIFVQKIGDDKVTRITSETVRDISGYLWANDNRLLYIKDSGGDENFQLYAVDKDGANAKDLTPFDKVRIQIIDELEEQEDEIIIGMNKNNPQLFEPYRLHIKTGAYEQIAENTNPAEPIDGWMTDHQGRLRVATKIKDGINTVVMYRDTEDQPFKEVLSTDFRITMQPLFFDFDNSSIVYAASNLGRDKTAIVKFDMATGKEAGPPIFTHKEVDVTNLNFSKKRKVLTSIVYVR